MLVKDFVKAGLRCPSCKSGNLRAGYHEWHLWDCWICEDCGLRWREDIGDSYTNRDKPNLFINMIKRKTEMKNRLIWVLAVSNNPEKALKNPKSSDEGSYEKFIGLEKKKVKRE